MKRFLNSRFGESIILIASSLLNLLFTVICFSVRLTNLSAEEYNQIPSLWNAKEILTENYIIRNINTIFVIAFFIGLILFVAAAILSLLTRKKTMFYVSVGFNIALSVAVLFLHVIIKILKPGAVACAIISIIISAATLVFLLIRRSVHSAENKRTDATEEKIASPANVTACKITLIVCECLSALVMALMLFVPVFTQTDNGVKTSFVLIRALSDASYPVYVNIIFMAVFVSCFVGLIYFVSTLSHIKRPDVFAKKAYEFTLGIAIFTLAFFLAGYALTFYLNRTNKDFVPDFYYAKTASYVPFIFALASLCAASVARGRIGVEYLSKGVAEKTQSLKIEPLIYVALLTLITFATLIVNVIKVSLSLNDVSFQDVNLSGWKLIKDAPSLEAGFQLMSFVLFAVLLTSALMFIISLVSFFAKNKDYYKVLKTAAISNIVFVGILGLFGVYFGIAQKVNYENISALLNFYQITIPEEFDYKASSQAVYLLAASVVVLIIMLIRKQFNLAIDQTEMEVTLSNPEDFAGASQNGLAPRTNDGLTNEPFTERKLNSNFDACPAFTELDAKTTVFENELMIKRANLFENLTLPNLVRFVVDYARECRLHLSYSAEDMATFVAGLGASRLSILQGMSGTGKTSLPKIFTEAVMGTCEIVEVESSWRDKNELLGYYNEFSKCYTPKKFTQCLYKAKLNPQVFTLIVLDEMNLSRIEYYFSDFLSLMENEEDKREIKLLNVNLFRLEEGKKIPYKGLTDGHTVKIPPNVWFVGTANRDESTFAISDKVYDRAQTMNFNKRAPKIHSFGEPLAQKFVSYEMISALFDEAKRKEVFDAEDNATVKKVEKLLAPYNISFGNRILRQMEDFVKIYCACFGDRDAAVKDAVEKIMLSKVVSKLENKVVENKEALATEFDRLGLAACSEFVRKLNED